MFFLLRSSRCLLQIQKGPRHFHSSPLRAGQFYKVDIPTLDKLKKQATDEKRLLLLDFYADWCKPCHMLSPILERITSDPDVKTGSGRPVDLVTVDTETEDGFNLTLKYSVRAFPTVLAIQDGEEVNRFVGALPEPAVRKFVEEVQ